MVDVVVLPFSSSRSDPIQHRKWRCLREMHMYGTSTSPPSSVQQVGWIDRLDLQHDGVVQRWRVSAAGLRLRAVGRERNLEGSSMADRVEGVGEEGCAPVLYI